MKAEYINPFVTSLHNTFRTMADCEVRRGALRLSTGPCPSHDVSGIIGLSGKAIGTVVLSLSRSVALRAASAMLMTECTELNADVTDAVGELTNMVAGAAKAQLEQLDMSIGLPTVIIGSGHTVRFPSNVQPLCVPFDTEWGPLALDVGLTEAAVPAGV